MSVTLSWEVGTQKCYSYRMESVEVGTFDEQIERLVREMIGRLADKWTMVILDVLEEHGTLRFTQLAKHVGDISQKMLTKTLRQLEADGLVTRTVHPVIPPHVEYTLTPLGHSLSEAFCSVWLWAEANLGAVAQARAAFSREG